MDSVSRYGFINSKLRARIGKMREDGLSDRMIKASNLVEAVSYLAGTRFGPLIKVYDETADLLAVEQAMTLAEIGRHRDIIAYLDRDTAMFVSVLLEKIETDNLKNAIRLWYSSNLSHHPMSHKASYIIREKIVSPIEWDMIINAREYKEIIKAVGNSPYHAALSSFSEDDIKERGLFDPEVMLDRLWYERLFPAMSRLSGEDRMLVHRMYSVEADMKNILHLIRYRYLGTLSEENMRKVLIPYGLIWADLLRDDDGIYTAKEIRASATKHYSELSDLFDDLELAGEDGMSQSEVASRTLKTEAYMEKKMREETESLLRVYPFTIGTIISYLSLCRAEDDALKAILSAKYYEWSEDRIRRELNGSVY
ncbi:MAG: V-type ATPase subunit [Bullifex sp.]